jgi:hypothetical protein
MRSRRMEMAGTGTRIRDMRNYVGTILVVTLRGGDHLRDLDIDVKTILIYTFKELRLRMLSGIILFRTGYKGRIL